MSELILLTGMNLAGYRDKYGIGGDWRYQQALEEQRVSQAESAAALNAGKPNPNLTLPESISLYTQRYGYDVGQELGRAAYEAGREYYAQNPSQRFIETLQRAATQKYANIGSSGTLLPQGQLYPVYNSQGQLQEYKLWNPTGGYTTQSNKPFTPNTLTDYQSGVLNIAGEMAQSGEKSEIISEYLSRYWKGSPNTPTDLINKAFIQGAEDYIKRFTVKEEITIPKPFTSVGKSGAVEIPEQPALSGSGVIAGIQGMVGGMTKYLEPGQAPVSGKGTTIPAATVKLPQIAQPAIPGVPLDAGAKFTADVYRPPIRVPVYWDTSTGKAIDPRTGEQYINNTNEIPVYIAPEVKVYPVGSIWSPESVTDLSKAKIVTEQGLQQAFVTTPAGMLVPAPGTQGYLWGQGTPRAPSGYWEKQKGSFQALGNAIATLNGVTKEGTLYRAPSGEWMIVDVYGQVPMSGSAGAPLPADLRYVDYPQYNLPPPAKLIQMGYTKPPQPTLQAIAAQYPELVSTRDYTAKAIAAATGYVSPIEQLSKNLQQYALAENVKRADYQRLIDIVDNPTALLILQGKTPEQAINQRLQEVTGGREKRYYTNMLDNYLQSNIALSSAYHHWALDTGRMQAPNPYEATGDVALAIKQGATQEGRVQLTKVSPAYAEVYKALPGGIGVEDWGWQMAKDDSRAAPDFSRALDLLSAQRGSLGVYGGLSPVRDYTRWNAYAQTMSTPTVEATKVGVPVPAARQWTEAPSASKNMAESAIFIEKAKKPTFELTPGTPAYNFARDEFGKTLTGGAFSPAFNATGVLYNPKMGSGDYEYGGDFLYKDGTRVSRFVNSLGAYFDVGEQGVMTPRSAAIRSGGSPGAIVNTNIPPGLLGAAVGVPASDETMGGAFGRTLKQIAGIQQEIVKAPETVGNIISGLGIKVNLQPDLTPKPGTKTLIQELTTPSERELADIERQRQELLVNKAISQYYDTLNEGISKGHIYEDKKNAVWNSETKQYDVKLVATEKAPQSYLQRLTEAGNYLDSTLQTRDAAQRDYEEKSRKSVQGLITYPLFETSLATGQALESGTYPIIGKTGIGIQPWKESVTKGAERLGFEATSPVTQLGRGGVGVVFMPATILTSIGRDIIPGAEWIARHPGEAARLAIPQTRETVKGMASEAQARPVEFGVEQLSMFVTPDKWSPVWGRYSKVPTGETYTGYLHGRIPAAIGEAVRKATGVEIPSKATPPAELGLTERIVKLAETGQIPEYVRAPHVIFDPFPMLTRSGMRLPVTGGIADTRILTGTAFEPETSTILSPKWIEHPASDIKTRQEVTIKTEYEPTKIDWNAPSSLVRPASLLPTLGFSRGREVLPEYKGTEGLSAISALKQYLGRELPFTAYVGTPKQLSQFIERPGYVPMASDALVGTKLMLTKLKEGSRLEQELIKKGVEVDPQQTRAYNLFRTELKLLSDYARGFSPERINDPYIEAKKITGGLIPKGYEKQFLDILKNIDPNAYLSGTYAMALQSYVKKAYIPEIDIISDYHQAYAKAYGDWYARLLGGTDKVKIELGDEASTVYTKSVKEWKNGQPVEFGDKWIKRLDIHNQRYGMGVEEFGVSHSPADIVTINGIRMMPLDALYARKLSTIMAYTPAETTGELIIGAKPGKAKNIADTLLTIESRKLATYEKPGRKYSVTGELERRGLQSAFDTVQEMLTEKIALPSEQKTEALKRLKMPPKPGEPLAEGIDFITDFAQGNYRKSLFSPTYIERGGLHPYNIGRDIIGLITAASPVQVTLGKRVEKGAAYDRATIIEPEYGILGGRLREKPAMQVSQISLQSPVTGIKSFLTRRFGVEGATAALPWEGTIPLFTRYIVQKGIPLEYNQMGEVEGGSWSVTSLTPRKHPTKTVKLKGEIVAEKMPPQKAMYAGEIIPEESGMFFGRSDKGVVFRENILQGTEVPSGMTGFVESILTGASGKPSMGYAPLGEGMSIAEGGVRISDTSRITVPMLTEYTKKVGGTEGYGFLEAGKEAMRRAIRAEPEVHRDLVDVLKSVESIPKGAEREIAAILQKYDIRVQGATSNIAFQKFGLTKTGDLDLSAVTMEQADAAAYELMKVYQKYAKNGEFINNFDKRWKIDQYIDHPMALDKTVQITEFNEKTGRFERKAGAPQDKAFSVHLEEFGEDLPWGLKSGANPAKAPDVIIDGVRFQSYAEQLMNKATTGMYFSIDEKGNFYIGTKPVKSPRFGKDLGDMVGDLINRRRILEDSFDPMAKREIRQIDQFISDIERYAINKDHPTVKIYSEGVPTSSGIVYGESIRDYAKRLTKFPEAGAEHPIRPTRVAVPGTKQTIRVGDQIAGFFSKYGTTAATYGAIGIGAAIAAPYVTSAFQTVLGGGTPDEKRKGLSPLQLGVIGAGILGLTRIEGIKGQTISWKEILKAQKEGKLIELPNGQRLRPDSILKTLAEEHTGEQILPGQETAIIFDKNNKIVRTIIGQPGEGAVAIPKRLVPEGGGAIHFHVKETPGAAKVSSIFSPSDIVGAVYDYYPFEMGAVKGRLPTGEKLGVIETIIPRKQFTAEQTQTIGRILEELHKGFRKEFESERYVSDPVYAKKVENSLLNKGMEKLDKQLMEKEFNIKTESARNEFRTSDEWTTYRQKPEIQQLYDNLYENTLRQAQVALAKKAEFEIQRAEFFTTPEGIHVTKARRMGVLKEPTTPQFDVIKYLKEPITTQPVAPKTITEQLFGRETSGQEFIDMAMAGEKKIVLREGNTVVGAMSYSPEFGGYYIDWAGSVKAGTGTKLIRQLETIAQRKGVTRLITAPTEAAKPFWKKMGFRQDGIYAVKEVAPKPEMVEKGMVRPRTVTMRGIGREPVISPITDEIPSVTESVLSTTTYPYISARERAPAMATAYPKAGTAPIEIMGVGYIEPEYPAAARPARAERAAATYPKAVATAAEYPVSSGLFEYPQSQATYPKPATYAKTATYPKTGTYAKTASYPEYQPVGEYPTYAPVGDYSPYVTVGEYPSYTPVGEYAKYPAAPEYPKYPKAPEYPKYPVYKPVEYPPYKPIEYPPYKPVYPPEYPPTKPPKYPPYTPITPPPYQPPWYPPKKKKEEIHKKRKRKVVTPKHWEFAPGLYTEEAAVTILGISGGDREVKQSKKKTDVMDIISSGQFKMKKTK